MFVNDYQVFSLKYLKSSQKSSAASYTPETFYALSHPIHGRGMKKNVNAKCGYVMQKYYLCSRKAAPDRIEVYISLKKKKGKVLEWLKRHAWKACIRQKRIGGSNPPLSAQLRLFPGFRTGSPWLFTFSKLHFHSHHILQYRYPSAA